jgi:hypothetical protein
MQETEHSNNLRPANRPPASVVLALLAVLLLFGSTLYIVWTYLT